MVLEAATKDGNQVLAEQLDFILSSLYPLLQHLPNYSDSLSVKNYNELLRCFEILACAFADKLCVPACLFAFSSFSALHTPSLTQHTGGGRPPPPPARVVRIGSEEGIV